MKRQLNEYLFYELGLDLEGKDSSQVSEEWPFLLNHLERINFTDEEINIYGFEYASEKYFALDGNIVDFYSASGLDLKGIRRQIKGEKWIGEQNPVDLNTSKGDHPTIPRVPDRKKYIESLIKQFNSDLPYSILAGLYLESSSKYIALIEFKGEDNAHIIGDKITMRNIPFTTLSPERRLALGIGTLIEKGLLG